MGILEKEKNKSRIIKYGGYTIHLIVSPEHIDTEPDISSLKNLLIGEMAKQILARYNEVCDTLV